MINYNLEIKVPSLTSYLPPGRERTDILFLHNILKLNSNQSPYHCSDKVFKCTLPYSDCHKYISYVGWSGLLTKFPFFFLSLWTAKQSLENINILLAEIIFNYLGNVSRKSHLWLSVGQIFRIRTWLGFDCKNNNPIIFSRLSHPRRTGRRTDLLI